MGQGHSFQLSEKVTRRHSDGAHLKRVTLTSDLIDENEVYNPRNAADRRKGNTLDKSSLNRSTAELENFQNLDFIVRLQKTFIEATRARNLLAALDYNNHIDRDVIVNTDGTIRPNIGPKDQEDTAKATDENKTAALQAEVQQLRAENDRLLAICSANLERSENLNKDYERKIKGLEADVKQLEEEKHNLFKRLSETGTVRLTESNPNIGDVSDPNRPSQLAEQFTELYDSEWTDAFEYLSKVQGFENTRTVRTLLNILQTIYNVCFESRRKPKEQLREAILSYLGLSDEDKDILVIKKTERMLRECRAKHFEVLLGHVTKDIREQLHNQLEGHDHDILDRYAQKCIRLCWFMCIMDPQMHLDFGANKVVVTQNDVTQNDDENELLLLLDEATFENYSEQGMYMEYVVWPPLYLYKDGPLLKKGIAQGFNRSLEATYSVVEQ